MMKKITMAVIVASSLAAGSASAQTDFTSSGVITTVIPNAANGNVLFAIDGTTANPASCPNAGLLIDPSSAGSSIMQATVLTAFASGSTVAVGISTVGCSDTGFPRVDGIIVTP